LYHELYGDLVKKVTKVPESEAFQSDMTLFERLQEFEVIVRYHFDQIGAWIVLSYRHLNTIVTRAKRIV